MDHRQPSSHEMRARMGFAGSIAIGLGVGAAMNAATGNMGVSIGIGLAIAIVMMVAFTRGGRRRHPDASQPRPDHDGPSADEGTHG